MKLNELNFNELIQLDVQDLDSYSFSDYEENGMHHKNIVGYCTSCEEKGINTCDVEGFRLLNISHGAHTSDFIKSFTTKYDTTGWNKSGVMFIMEGPSKDYGIYEDITFTKGNEVYKKRPSKDWYWLHQKRDITGYPHHFKGGTYGEFVASAIVTFRLANAYLTNLIKCGMNDNNDNFKGIDDYKPECIENCYKKFLEREIDIINPRVIFTFGSKVYNYVYGHVGERVKVVGLPHPAGQRRGFKDEYYNVLYFCMMAKWLYKERVIDEKSYIDLMRLFAE